jgi:hypothetical protein
MNKMLQNYQKGMSAFDNCHNSTVRSQWVALTDEIGEFVNEPSLSEIWDIIHAAGRWCYKLSGIPLNLLAYPTVRKHSQRFEEYGCIRSQRNCEGKCCKQLTVDIAILNDSDKNVQKQAVAELRELPSDNVFRLNALELLYNLRTILEVRQDIDREDRELIMELSPLYLQRLEDATQQGIEQGIQQGIEQGIDRGIQQGMQRGKRLIVESMLQVKFGEIDEELAQIIDPLIQLESLEITMLIMQLDRSELLARFNQSKNQPES